MWAVSHNQTACRSTYTKPYVKITTAIVPPFSQSTCSLQADGSWDVWKCVVAIVTTHTSCSLFSEKKHRGNSAFSPSICLASCLHAWYATISEANSLRRREAQWLTEVFLKAIHHLLTTARLTVEREGESDRCDLQTKTRRVIKSSWWRPSMHLNTERSPLQKHCWTKITNSCANLEKNTCAVYTLKEIAHPQSWQKPHPNTINSPQPTCVLISKHSKASH